MSVTRADAPELTTEQIANILTRPLEAASTFLASGVRIFDSTGPMRFPVAPSFYEQADQDPEQLAGGPSSTWWHGESEQITEADPEFSEVTLMPSTMKSVKVITRYSNELARASVLALDAVLQNRLVSDVAARVDGQLYSASGDGVSLPRGMFAWEGVQEHEITGDLTLDELLTAQGLALAANVPVERLRLYLRPEDFITLRAEKDAEDRYQLQPNAQSAAVPTILGMPVTVSPRIPAGYAAVADPTEIAVVRDAAPSVKVLTERYADYDEQAIRVVTRYDAAPLNPGAVVKITGIGSTENGGGAD